MLIGHCFLVNRCSHYLKKLNQVNRYFSSDNNFFCEPHNVFSTRSLFYSRDKGTASDCIRAESRRRFPMIALLFAPKWFNN